MPMEKLLHIGREPFDDDDATIAAYLNDLSPAALLMSLIHMSGDRALLDSELRPRSSFIFDPNDGHDGESLARLHDKAKEVIARYRDGGYVLPPAPTPDQVLEMMRVLVCQDIPARWHDLVHAELRLEGADPDAVELASTRVAREALPVIVIGCGEAGLLAGIRLKEAGFPFTILEKNPDVGGTWYENQYPGCRVDIPNHFYSYSFATNDGWSEYFCQQPELLAYLRRVFEQSGIAPHVRWNTEVTAARWDDTDSVWRVSAVDAGGRREEVVGRALISAVGQLNRPKIPDLPGAKTFRGPSFHTARWDHSVDLSGKRVAVIGAGATGFQLVPAIAEDAAQVTVYQRSPQWMAPNPIYHARTGPGVGWAVRHLPHYAQWYRLYQAWHILDQAMDGGHIDPDWNGGNQSVSEINDFFRQVFTDWLTQQVKDPELLAKTLPQYPPFGKRMLQDNGTWLATLQRPDVELVTEGIVHIDPDGITTVDGVSRPADILVWATGFHVDRVMWPMEITGSKGQSLNQVWDGKPAAYLGITIPDFPNLFCMYGPGTNSANGSSIIFNSECQARYILGCLDLLASSGADTMEVREDIHEDYHQRTQDELARTVWSHPAVNSYYKHADGKIYTVLPWRSVDYWAWTRRPNPQDFTFQEPTR